MSEEQAERDWALLRSGKLDEELQAVKEEGERSLLFSQLRYIALERGWKPGWAAHFYKTLYGSWPDRGWEKVPPMRPTEDLYHLVDRRQRSFGQAMKQREEERRARDERERGVEEGDAADAVQQGGEGTGSV
jgi:hypothetical protein